MTTASSSRRRSIAWTAGIVVAVVALYAVVVGMYATGSAVVSSTPASHDAGTVVLALTPEKMDTTTNRLSISVLPGQDESGTVTNGIVAFRHFAVLISAAAGSKATEYPADQLIGPVEASLAMDGEVQKWPFDRYTVHTVMAAVEEDAGGETVPLPAAVQASKSGIPGWDVSVVTGATENGLISVDITASRSLATVAFGIVLLSLMIVIPVLVLTVAITVLRGRRKVEVTLMGWIGAMLFATIPLRNFLPGSPPIGSWIDYLVVLWVLAALVAGLVIFVFAWWRQRPV